MFCFEEKRFKTFCKTIVVNPKTKAKLSLGGFAPFLKQDLKK